MLTRRSLCLGGLASAVLGSHAQARTVIAHGGPEPAGTVVIRNRSRTLDLVLGRGMALRYPVAVGRIGRQWIGLTHVVEKVPYPVWQPPAIVRRDSPHLPALVPPGPSNPLGTRALVLARPEYAIHGTNAPHSIGRSASYGCFRMHNRDVEDLFERVGLGTPVLVLA